MSDFAADWLTLRAPADAAARSAALTRRLNALLDRRETILAVDLAAGHGNNARFLAPRLARPQTWVLVERDEDLLRQALGALPAALGLARDLTQGFEGLPLAEADLVTASAVLDLVSARWLDSLVAACRRGPAALLVALSVEGRVAWSPEAPDDAAILAASRAHQRRDKGFGPALGPAAPAALRRSLARAGYRVREAPSDWRLGPEQGALQAAFAEGRATAAAEAAPSLKPRAESWLERRRSLIADGRSRLVVGHRDLLAWPIRR